MKQVHIPGNFGDGHTFKYNSIVGGGGSSGSHVGSNMPSPTSAIVHPDDLPRAIQLNIAGVNESGQSIVNIMMVEFKNTCISGNHHDSSNIPAPPVIGGGKQSTNVFGWTRLVRKK